jgi:hypothetical protein
MSVRALSWSFQLPLRDMAAKAALHALADHADEDWKCWPSIERIALFAGCNIKTARKAIQRLVDLGVVNRISRPGTSDLFRINSDWDPSLNRESLNRHPSLNRDLPKTALTPPKNDPYPSLNREGNHHNHHNPQRYVGSDELSSDEPTPVDQALEIYNLAAKRVGWTQARKLTEPRRRQLKARLVDCGGIDGWRDAIAKAEASAFLTGKTAPGNGHEGWRADLDFLLRQAKFLKLVEGAYDGRPVAAPAKGFN